MSDAPSRSPSRRGRTLKLYLADGTPSGVITAELLEVTKPDFENFQIAVPSLEQQRLIADALDAEAMEITLLEQRDGLLQSQKRGLMQKLLTGEWRLDERFDPPMLAPRAALAGGAA